MPVLPRSLEIHSELTAIRHDIHAHPELAYQENRTSDIVAGKLKEWGLEVTRGLGKTGVVGTLRKGNSLKSIGLRADMDCLPMDERNDFEHRSQNPGRMHACGHDGHTAMLLGAAKVLAAEGGFDGTVRFLFQPAEEWGGGALAMLEDGLLERFPFDEVYGLHNWPGLAVGRLATRAGPLMAAEDVFEIVVKGRGAHAARPHQAKDALVTACAIVTALQTIVSRTLDPGDTAVVSVTELLTDGTRNVLPATARIRGDCRSFRPEVSLAIEEDRKSTRLNSSH